MTSQSWYLPLFFKGHIVQRSYSLVLNSYLALALGALTWLIIRMLTSGYSAFDHVISHALRGLRSNFLDIPLLSASLVGDWVVVTATVVAMALVLIYCRQWKLLVGVLVCMALAGAFVVGMKSLIQAPRPTALYEGVDALSFPSGHTTFSTLLAGLLAWFAWQKRELVLARSTLILAIVMIVLIPLSRMYLGAHWPTDILAGFFFSTSVVVLFAKVFKNSELPEYLVQQVLVASLSTYIIAGAIYIATHWQAGKLMYAGS